MIEFFLLEGSKGKPTPGPIQGNYTKMTSGLPKYAFTLQPIDDKLYSFSGLTTGGSYVTAMNVYDTITDQWSTVTGVNNPSARYGYACCVHDGKYWIFGGYNSGTILNDVHAFDPTNNTWTPMGTLPTGRYYATAVSYNGKIYLYGGNSSAGQLNQTLAYDPSNKSFAVRANGSASIHGHNAVVIRDKMYVMGGITSEAIKSTFIYDITNNSWSTTGELPGASAYGAAVARNNKIYRYGGGNSGAGAQQATLLVFDPLVGNWSVLNNGPINRSVLGMAGTLKALWIYGGYTGTAQGEVYMIT